MMITMITTLPPPSSPPCVAELREARAENDRLQDRVSMLNALLDEAVVAAAYKCYDCKHLFAALRNSPHSLASTTEFKFHLRALRGIQGASTWEVPHCHSCCHTG